MIPNIDYRAVLAVGGVALVAFFVLKNQAGKAAAAVGNAIDVTSSENIVNRKVHDAIGPGLGTNKLTGKPNTIGSSLYFWLND